MQLLSAGRVNAPSARTLRHLHHLRSFVLTFALLWGLPNSAAGMSNVENINQLLPSRVRARWRGSLRRARPRCQAILEILDVTPTRGEESIERADLDFSSECRFRIGIPRRGCWFERCFRTVFEIRRRGDSFERCFRTVFEFRQRGGWFERCFRTVFGILRRRRQFRRQLSQI